MGDGRRIRIGEIEVNAAGDGDVLFIHGAGMNSRIWERQLSSVGGIAVDLPNHGKSGKMNVRSLREYAEFLVEFVEIVNLNPIIVAHSMGGAIAQEYMVLGGSARGAVLVSTGPSLKVNPRVFEGIERNFEETVGRFVRWMFSRGFDGKKITENIKRMIIEEGKETFRRDLLLCDSFDLQEKYRKNEIRFECPVMIVCGNEDAVTPPHLSEFLKGYISNSKLAFIHGCGHLPMVEKTEEFNKILREFQDELRD
mgnify:FL=1